MDLYSTVAEIAATLIGFVAVFFVFGSKKTLIPKPEFDDFIVSAICAVLFSFLPTLLESVVSDVDLRWRVACGLFGFVHFVIMVRSLRELVRSENWSFVLSDYLFLLASITVVALKLTVASGCFLNEAYYVYLLGLVWLIFNSLYMFYRIVSKTVWPGGA